jgi:hypothetical protein
LNKKMNKSKMTLGFDGFKTDLGGYPRGLFEPSPTQCWKKSNKNRRHFQSLAKKRSGRAFCSKNLQLPLCGVLKAPHRSYHV